MFQWPLPLSLLVTLIDCSEYTHCITIKECIPVPICNNIIYFFNERFICYLIHNFSGGKQCPCKSLLDSMVHKSNNFAIENYFNTIDLQKKKIVANRILLAVHQKGKQNMNNSERYLSPVNSL